MISIRSPGTSAWEEALFALCNEVLDAERSLVVSAAMSSRECPIVLPDLQSRLARLATFQVQSLGDDERVQAMQLRAKLRGLDLPDETARYLLSRSRRDMASLYELLDKLDSEALRAQRRLTIPFVKEVLGPNFRAISATRVPSARASDFSSSDSTSGLRPQLTWLAPYGVPPVVVVDISGSVHGIPTYNMPW